MNPMTNTSKAAINAIIARLNANGTDEIETATAEVLTIYEAEVNRHDAIPVEDQGSEEAEALRSAIHFLEEALSFLEDEEVEEAIESLQTSLESQIE